MKMGSILNIKKLKIFFDERCSFIQIILSCLKGENVVCRLNDISATPRPTVINFRIEKLTYEISAIKYAFTVSLLSYGSAVLLK